MKLPPVPGPRDVVRLAERGADAVEQLLSAAPRVAQLLDEAGSLVGRASELVSRIDETRTAADGVVRRTDEVVTRAEGTIARVDGIVTRAETSVEEVTVLTTRLRELLDAIEPSTLKLQPTLERLADTTHPAEVDALVELIDHLPLLATRMEAEIVPIMESLSTVGPDLRDLIDLSRELNEMLGAVPGLGRVKARIDEAQAERDRR